MSDNIKKLSFAGLAIEITRKCNLSCKHCMRGDAQNLTISQEVIDAFLSQTSEIYDLLLTGGEPLLELDTVEYLLHAINRHGVNVHKIDIITNGTILSARAADILLNFTEQNPHCLVFFGVSDDVFHDKAQSKKCFDFYASLFGEKIPVLMHGELPFLRSCGRVQVAKEIDGIKVTGVGENSIRPHRINVSDGVVHCSIDLLANGNIALKADTSFDISDKLSIGNILEEPLAFMLDKHNKTCVCLCDECYAERVAYNFNNFSDPYTGNAKEWMTDKYRLSLFRRRLELVWQARRWAAKQLPEKDIRYIIQATVIDNDDFAEAIEYVVVNRYRYDSRVSEETRKLMFTLDASSKYKKHFKKKFPFATHNELGKLSLIRVYSEIAALMNLDDFLFGLFEGNAPLPYFSDIEDRLKNHGITLDDWSECAKIPDTLDVDKKEDANDEPTNELQSNAAS